MDIDLTAIVGDPNIIRPLSNFFYYIRNKKVMIIGAGGGGDVCGCLPVYQWLQDLEAQPILSSLTWERTEVFNNYGPRSFDQIEGLDRIEGMVAWGSGKTKIKKDGTLFQGSRISAILQEPIIFLDITKGIQNLVKSMQQFIQKYNIDFIIGLDVGGDILAQGNEAGLRSPLADAIVLTVLAQLSIPKAIGIFGLNCDGELSLKELNDYLLQYNLKDWVYGQRIHSSHELDFMEDILNRSGAITEASRIPLRFYRGERGEILIRKGTRKVMLDELVTHTFFLRVDEIYGISPIAKSISTSSSIEEANSILLNQLNIISEYEAEKRKLSNSP